MAAYAGWRARAGPAPAAPGLTPIGKQLIGLARDRAYGAALLAAFPVLYFLAACTDLILAPHWPAPRPALLMIGVAPLLEEIIFRAGLQDTLASRWSARIGGLSVANTITAIVFAVLHLWQHPPLWAAATVVPALIFGLFYERHRTLAAPIGLHAGYNAAYLLLVVP